MKIKDIRYIPRIQDFKLIAGANGISRDIRNVVIFEYEDEKNYEDDYYHHDFIITSLIFAKSNPALIEPMLKKMMQLGASGIAIKRAYYQELPNEVIAFANAHELPIFFFDDIFIEDVIVSIASYMQNEKRYSIYQQEITELITENRSRFEMERYCRLMNNSFLGYMSAVYIECVGNDNRSIELIFHALLMRHPIEARKDYQFYQYHCGLFLLYNTAEPVTDSLARQRLVSMIEQFGTRFSDYHAGFSTCVHGAQDFDLCFRESYLACCYVKVHGHAQANYAELGIYQLLLPLLMQKDCHRKYEQLLTALYQPEGNGSHELIDTLTVCCTCDFNISTTATRLCQHPNTIRYRLKKASELMQCSSQMELYLNAMLLSSYQIFADII